MKKILALLLTTTLILGLAGCSDSKEDNSRTTIAESPNNNMEITKTVNENSNNHATEETNDLIPTVEQNPTEEPTPEPIRIRSDIKQGDIVFLGSYEQDNDLTNGKEPIEWIVLSNDGNEALLISKYVLDDKEYNETGGNTTWADCTLRSWLNNDFFNYAFNETEKSLIKTTHLKNQNNTYDYCSAQGGSDTDDKVFLLTIEDVSNPSYGYKTVDPNVEFKLLSEDYAKGKEYGRDFNRRWVGTEYAKSRDKDALKEGYNKIHSITTWTIDKTLLYDPKEITGGEVPEKNRLQVCLYSWLRSPGAYNYEAAYVNGWGGIDVLGKSVDANYGICPAIVVNLK